MSRPNAVKAINTFARQSRCGFNDALDLLRESGEVPTPAPVAEVESAPAPIVVTLPEIVTEPSEVQTTLLDVDTDESEDE